MQAIEQPGSGEPAAADEQSAEEEQHAEIDLGESAGGPVAADRHREQRAQQRDEWQLLSRGEAGDQSFDRQQESGEHQRDDKKESADEGTVHPAASRRRLRIRCGQLTPEQAEQQQGGRAKSGHGDWQLHGEEAAEGDAARDPHQHVLRIAGERGHAADVRREAQRQQVGDRRQRRAASRRQHDRREQQTDRVVDEERREESGSEDEQDQQLPWRFRDADDRGCHRVEEPGESKVRDHDHHP